MLKAAMILMFLILFIIKRYEGLVFYNNHDSAGKSSNKLISIDDYSGNILIAKMELTLKEL